MSYVLNLKPYNHYRFLLADTKRITIFTYRYYLMSEAYKDMFYIGDNTHLLIGWF